MTKFKILLNLFLLSALFVACGNSDPKDSFIQDFVKGKLEAKDGLNNVVKSDFDWRNVKITKVKVTKRGELQNALGEDYLFIRVLIEGSGDKYVYKYNTGKGSVFKSEFQGNETFSHEITTRFAKNTFGEWSGAMQTP